MITLFFNWDIRSEKDQRDYLTFIFNDYLPTMGRLGINIKDAWLNEFGDGSEIMALGECEDLPTVRQIWRSREYRSLENRLLGFVENYSKYVARRNIKSTGT